MKVNILFVDDEQEVIDGYKRMLFSMQNEWTQFFAISGEEALKIMEENKIDVIISDMKMPGMDGTTLLSKVKEQFPGILRIILSGHRDEIKIIMSTSLAHQFLLKPCDLNQIKNVIEIVFSLRTNLENEKLMSVINGIGQLPSMPELYLKLESLLSSQDVSLEKVSNVISGDPAITAKILQTVNSAFFGLPRRVTGLLDALNLLGTNTIKSIILYLQSYSSANYPPETRQYSEAVGEHSLKVALIAKEIGRLEKQDRIMLDDIYVAGILHDIGKIILLQLPGYFKKLMILNKATATNSVDIEFDILGISHEWTGAYLLGIWGLPKSVVEAVAFHHSPSKNNESGLSVLTFIHVANALVDYKGDKFVGNEINVDFSYLGNLDLLTKLEFWWESTKKFREPEG